MIDARVKLTLGLLEKRGHCAALSAVRYPGNRHISGLDEIARMIQCIDGLQEGAHS